MRASTTQVITQSSISPTATGRGPNSLWLICYIITACDRGGRAVPMLILGKGKLSREDSQGEGGWYWTKEKEESWWETEKGPCPIQRLQEWICSTPTGPHLNPALQNPSSPSPFHFLATSLQRRGICIHNAACAGIFVYLFCLSWDRHLQNRSLEGKSYSHHTSVPTIQQEKWPATQ